MDPIFSTTQQIDLFYIAKAFCLLSAIVVMDHIVITGPKNKYKLYYFTEICMVLCVCVYVCVCVCVCVCVHYGKGYSFSI